MRGPLMTSSGNQDRRQPPFLGKRGKKSKGKRRKGKKASRPSPLHEAMVRAAT